MITDETFIEIWRALFVATPVFVTGILILMAYWNWGIPEPVIIKIRKAKKTSFWVWVIVRIIETVKGVLTWIFSSALIEALILIPGLIWALLKWIGGGILSRLFYIGGLTVMGGLAGLLIQFWNNQAMLEVAARSEAGWYVIEPAKLNLVWAGPLTAIGALIIFYAYWREEVKEND